MHCGQRLGKAWVGESGKHAGRDPAALDDVSHDQDQEIVEQPVERFLAAETYPRAKAALLAQSDPSCGQRLEATPGYFVPAEAKRRTLDTDFVLG